MPPGLPFPVRTSDLFLMVDILKIPIRKQEGFCGKNFYTSDYGIGQLKWKYRINEVKIILIS
jgi:hypothetical protein